MQILWILVACVCLTGVPLVSSQLENLGQQTKMQSKSDKHIVPKLSPISSRKPPSIVRARSPGKNYRPFYRWNNTLNAFQQLQYRLPLNSTFVSNSNFFQDYHPENAANPLEDNTQGQQKVLLDIFDGKLNGYYIDLASNDWKFGSNTIDLEHFFNWTGICIEPNSMYFQGILSNRKCTLVASPVYHLNNVMIQFHLDEGLGGIVEKGFDNEKAASNIVELPTVTMGNILNTFAPKSKSAVQVFDYLSLDVEGAEYNAVVNFDFSTTIFHVITVERPKDFLHNLLIRNGYWFLTQTWTTNSMYWRPDPFGEMFYLHYTFPRFTELMNKYRPSATLRYFHADRWHNPTFLLRPSWPLASNASLEYNELVRDGDLLKCGEHSRQIYLYRGKSMHAIPSSDVFLKIDDGKRDFKEVIILSSKFFSKFSVGKEVDERSASLPADDPFWLVG